MENGESTSVMNENKTKSFWMSAPGILTGIAALITAVVGLLGAFHQMGLIGGEQPTPKSAEDASDNGFRIAEVMLRADPFNYSGPCPVTINFSGRISVVGGGGQVSYKFLRSDGASAPVQTLEFTSSGSREVSTTWRLGGQGQSFNGWQSIKTFDPGEKQSNKATFQIRCE